MLWHLPDGADFTRDLQNAGDCVDDVIQVVRIECCHADTSRADDINRKFVFQALDLFRGQA